MNDSDVFSRLSYQGFELKPDGDETWTVTDPWAHERPRENMTVEALEEWLDRHAAPSSARPKWDEATYCRERAIARVCSVLADLDDDAVRQRVAEALQNQKDDPGLPALVDYVLGEMDRP